MINISRGAALVVLDLEAGEKVDDAALQNALVYMSMTLYVLAAEFADHEIIVHARRNGLKGAPRVLGVFGVVRGDKEMVFLHLDNGYRVKRMVFAQTRKKRIKGPVQHYMDYILWRDC